MPSNFQRKIISSLEFYQFSSVTQSSPTLCDPKNQARQASLSITNSQSSLRLTSIQSVMPSSHLIFGCPLLLLPPIPPSIRVFSNESTLPMRWPKYWSFSFSIIPSREIPGLISFRMDWLDLLAVQGIIQCNGISFKYRTEEKRREKWPSGIHLACGFSVKVVSF